MGAQSARGPPSGYIKSPGVFPEDYFRCVKENKEIFAEYSKVFKHRGDMALSRFDNDENTIS